MVFFEKNKNALKVVDIDNETKERVLEDAKNYQIVKRKTITWEKLDEDRSGEDTDYTYYDINETNKNNIDFSIIIKDGDFFGVNIFYTSTTSWNAGLNKESTLSGCELYIDGTTKGSAVNKSTYDSPNNYDEVKTEYYLRKKD